MPILHLSQLIGVAAGLEDSELKFKRHVVLGRSRSKRSCRSDRGARGAAAAAVAWGWFEAGWVRLRTLEVPLAGLPAELDGLRIAHLSDFHLGLPSRGAVAVERAVEWTARATARPRLPERRPALPRRRRGAPAPAAGAASAALPSRSSATTTSPSHAIRSRSRPACATSRRRRLLSDEGETIELRGRRVHVAGSDPRARWSKRRKRPAELAAVDDADLSILLCHYPQAIDGLPAGAFDLVLAGHMHDGQISVPLPGREAAPRASDGALHERPLPPPGRRPARLAGPRHDVRPLPLLRAAGGDRAGPPYNRGVSARVTGLTGATLVTVPTVCHGCVWWQSRRDGVANKRRWIEKAEEEWGAWGTVYYDDDGRVLGSMQYGPSPLCSRARASCLPARRPTTPS